MTTTWKHIEAPPEHNEEFATVTTWSMQITCRCGQESSIFTDARYVRKACIQCGTVWELAPSVCDSTPYTVEKTSPQVGEQ